jgi:hypothetical protein
MDNNLLSTASQLGFTTSTIDTTANPVVASKATIWTCPNRPTLPAPNVWPNPATWAMGYMYFGGVTNWEVSSSKYPSASPIKASTARSAWMLAGDLMMRFGVGQWTDPTSPNLAAGTTSLPAHKASGGLPAGGNEVFADGSVSWIKVQQMYNFYTPLTGRNFYFYQSDLGSFPLPLSAVPQFPN